MTEATSSGGRYTVVVESDYEYESEIADVPWGDFTAYLIDNSSNEKSVVYSYSGEGHGNGAEIFFSSDGKFAVFQRQEQILTTMALTMPWIYGVRI